MSLTVRGFQLSYKAMGISEVNVIIVLPKTAKSGKSRLSGREILTFNEKAVCY